MKEIYQARDAAEAHFLRAQLASHGIRAVVQGENLQLGAGEIPFFLALPTVLVHERDVVAAQVVVERFRHPPASEGEPWACPDCGELIEPQFGACWRCATGEPKMKSQTCWRCGHSLRGLPSRGECPECGEPFQR